MIKQLKQLSLIVCLMLYSLTTWAAKAESIPVQVITVPSACLTCTGIETAFAAQVVREQSIRHTKIVRCLNVLIISLFNSIYLAYYRNIVPSSVYVYQTQLHGVDSGDNTRNR